MNLRWVGHTLARWLLSAIFLYAGLSKIYNPQDFALSLANYNWLPEFLIKPAALAIPAWELAAALALLVPGWQQAGAGLAGILSLMFLTAVGSALARAGDIPCGCFGPASGKAGSGTLVLDLGLLLLAGFAIIMQKNPKLRHPRSILDDKPRNPLTQDHHH